MHRRQHRITFGQALAVLAGLAALAFGGERGPGVMFSRWSPQDEISSLRTENSKTFDNHDGTRSVVIAGPRSPGPAPLEDSTKQVGNDRDNWPCVWYMGANYFRCQHLYLDSELNFSGYITKIAFWSDSAGSDTLNQSHHWLREVSDTFSSLPDSWISEGTQVWDSTLVRSDIGWNDLLLNAPFLHVRDSGMLVSYRHLDGSRESLYKCYRASYQGIYPIRAHWGYSASNPQPPLSPKTYRANILITYVPLSETLDVQTTAILAPRDSVLWSQPRVPEAVVENGGISPVDFAVQFRISDGYANSVNVYGLLPGLPDTVSFPPWTPDSSGRLVVRCSTCLTHDQQPGNNRETSLVFVVYHDVGVSHVVAPTGIVPLGDSVCPDVMVRNYGTAPENPWLVAEIICAGSPVYAESIQQFINADSSVEVHIPSCWHADSLGDYDVRAWTRLPGDMNSSNDTAHGSFQVQYLPLHDAGATRILAPMDSVVQDSVVQPRAIVRNFGRVSEDIPVVFSITRDGIIAYSDSVRATVPPGVSDTAAFRPWIAADSGNCLACVRTCLPGDLDSTNDAVSDSFRVTRRLRHDIGVSAIIAPNGAVDSGETITPGVQLRNLGDFSQSGTVRFSISDSAPYRCSVLVTGLSPDSMRAVAFPRWIARRIGTYVARCSLEFTPDDNRANDTLSRFFVVQEPTPWHQMADLPEGDRHKGARGGAALAAGGTDMVYALKGNGTREFYAYRATGDSWSRCCSIPRTRKSARSAALCYSPGIDRVYAASANSSELWQYRPEDNTWRRRADVPVGNNGRRPGNGVCLAAMDTGSIYLLKGNGTSEFSAFDHVRDTWLSLSPVPAGVSGRGCRAGSCLIAVRDYLYLLKGGGNEFFAYSALDDAWYNRAPLPTTGAGAGRKAARAGTAIAHDHDIIYVLEGGKCGDLWWYDTFGDSWVEQRSLPLGPGLRPVADGGALAFAAGRLWALKGNNTREFWSYQPQNADRTPPPAGRLKEIQGQSAVCAPQFEVRAAPNPFTGSARVSCSLPAPGNVSLKLFDVNGRLAQTLSAGWRPAGTFSAEIAEHLPPGVYLLRLSTSAESITRQIVRQ